MKLFPSVLLYSLNTRLTRSQPPQAHRCESRRPVRSLQFLLASAASAFLAGCASSNPSPTPPAPPEASVKTINIPAFFKDRADPLPGLQEAGFATSPAFEEDFDAPDWNTAQRNWQIGTWKQNGAMMDPSRARVIDGKMVQTVLDGEPFRGGTMQSRREFGFGRWLARVKPTSVSGIVNSVFTKDWDNLKTAEPNDGLKGEVDIEFLSKTFAGDKGEVHLAIHLLGYRPLWHADVPLDFNPAAEYHVWGFDILPDKVVWHVDGKIIHTWHYTDKHFIHEGYEMMFNSWSNRKWVEGPPSEPGDYHIDWVRFYPLVKTTGDR